MKVALMALVLGGLSGFWVVKMMLTEWIYESHATLAMRSPSGTPKELEESERSLVFSEAVLGEVVDQLGLMSRWSVARERAMGLLAGKVRVEAMPGAQMIQIWVRDASARDCSMYANALSDAYRRRKVIIETAKSDERLKALREAIAAQEAIVEEKRKAMKALLEESKGSRDADQSDWEASLASEENILNPEGDPESLYSREMQGKSMEAPELSGEGDEGKVIAPLTFPKPDARKDLLMGTGVGVLAGGVMGGVLERWRRRRRD
ncbi:outer membrane translocation and assembly module TamA [Haloferula luteola]|uniref:Outer membrane translocation and assembly module TamA n=1 Tax=Haloferula luteola TaxID=595692 RepID=A0A840VCJ6_9BACT|nr:hypothetical protein [Haloferula luteola]MBB5351640.1 outer membrane translocation and assembly module TamA [Haloferula luteola]